MKVLVVIVTHNGKKHIDKCLMPICAESTDVTVMIIDNASTDGTLDFVRANYPMVVIVCNDHNAGFGAANNIGLRYAVDNGFDFVYLMNQDAWIEMDAFRKLVEVACRNPEYGIVSPLQVYADSTKLDQSFSKCISQELVNDILLVPDRSSEIYEVGVNRLIPAAHWLIRRDVIETVGGFSPVFFHYGEDNDYCNRLFFHGMKKGIAPGVVAVHNRENRISLNNRRYRLFTKWKQILCNPNYDSYTTFKQIVKSISQESLKCNVRIIPLLWNLIKNYGKCMSAKKESKSRGAFLFTPHSLCRLS